MDQEIVVSRLTNVFRRVFDLPDLTLKREMTADDLEDWDSLTHINLIVAAEKEFKVKFTTSEVAKLSNVGDLIDTISKKA
jgi:acyl carrier protein